MNSMQPGQLTLSIFSDCIHQFTSDGNVATDNYIFCRQMEALARYYKHTEIYCPFVSATQNQPLNIYSESSIHFTPLKNAGGNTIFDKLKIVTTIPSWIAAFGKASKNSDIIYQRFPNNLNIPGFFYCYLKKMKVFATYTGTWDNYSGEPVTYRFQKWLLKHFFRGPVWAYLNTEKEGNNIFNGYSPSYSLGVWEEESNQVENRIITLKEKGIITPVFVTVGALVKNKNQQYILEVFKILHQESFPFQLHVVGDGPLWEEYSNFIVENNLQEEISLRGKMGTEDLRDLYRKAHFLIQVPIAEGFGKVPMEGFFHGVIPLLSATAVAEQMTGVHNERGYLLSIIDAKETADKIIQIIKNNSILPGMIQNGRDYAKEKNLDNWSKTCFETVCSYYHL